MGFSMIKRPYLNLSFNALERMSENYKDDYSTLEVIDNELFWRTKHKRLLQLREKIKNRLQELLKTTSNRKYVQAYMMKWRIWQRFGTMSERGEGLRGKVIAVTGNGPDPELLMNGLVFWHGGFLGDSDIWQHNQLIVVGESEFSEKFLLESIDCSKEKKLHIHYLSQEAFIDYFETGELPQYYFKDPRVMNHRGLAFLATIGFHWPTTDVFYGYGFGHADYNSMSKHPLNTVFGYSVRAGIWEEARHKRLVEAIKPWPLGLGLQEVAVHIAYLIRDRKRTQPKKLGDAIERWESDLEWLKQKFYVNSIYNFHWPSGSANFGR